MHRWLRAVLVYALGIGLVLFGILGLVLPFHPGLVVIALGLGVLSLESKTARRARQRFLAWLAERDVESERFDRWRSRIEDWVPDDEDEDADGSADGESLDRRGEREREPRR
jgi:hypothetical protein